MPDPFLFGRTVFITGGTSGVGLAIAEKLALAGAKVAAGSRKIGDDSEYTDRVAGTFGQFGSRFHLARLDVRDGASIQAFVKDTETALGPIDILINAAGITAEQPIIGHSDDLWDQIIDTNLYGCFRTIRACLPGMIERGWGRIINIGSTAATTGWKDNPAYCASKAGLLGLTRCVALEGAPSGVGCAMISPTWVETDLMRASVADIAAMEGKGRSPEDITLEIAASNPQQRIIQPREIAAMAEFLCRDDALGLSMDNIQITGGALW